MPGLTARVRLVRARGRFAAGRPEDVQPLLLEALAAEREDPSWVQIEILAVLAIASASHGGLDWPQPRCPVRR